MKPQNSKDEAAAKRLLNLYNLLINLFWSVLALVPLVVFCYRFVTTGWLVVFSIPVVLSLFLPRYFFYRMQLANAVIVYKRLGVHLVNTFSQNGIFIQRLIKKRFPGFKLLAPNRLSVQRLLRQTVVFEKFHFATGLFFVLLTFYALFKNLFWWGVVLLVINLFYNIYPVLFQQYVRVRLKLVGGKEENTATIAKHNNCQRVLVSWAK